MDTTTKEQATNLNEVFSVTEERLHDIAKSIMDNYRMFAFMNTCNALVQRVFRDGDEAQKLYVAEKLSEYNIIAIKDKEDEKRITGFCLDVEEVVNMVFTEYTGNDKMVGCYFLGKLQERLNNYEGPENDDIADKLLGVISLQMARTSSVEDCLERFKDVIKSVEE